MEKLAVFKVVNDKLELCGYFDSKEEVTNYLKDIKGIMDKNIQHQLKGDYIAIPILYFNIQPTES